MIVTKTLMLFGLICLSFSAAEVKITFNKHGSLKNVFDSSFTKDSFSRIECEKSEKSTNSTKCQVFQVPLDDKYKTTTCDVVLDNHVEEEDVLLHNFGKDNVVITWWSENENREDHQYVRHTIVHLSDCKVYEANINVKDADFSAATWTTLRGVFLDNEDNTFSVYYFRTSFDDRLRTVTFNAQGKIVGHPRKTFHAPEDFDGMSITQSHRKDTQLVGVHYSNGTWGYDVVTKGKFDPGQLLETEANAVSTDYETTRTCDLQTVNSTEIRCLAFTDHSFGYVQFDVDQPITDLVIQNLANDQFLLAADNVDTVTRYGAYGQKLGTVKLDNLLCKEDFDIGAGFYLKNNKECLTRICSNENEYDLSEYCFSAEDFK